MDSRELRIGNLYDQFGNICEVDWVVLKDLSKAPKDQLWCKPIPLTEEWLIRMGFLQSIGKYGNEFHILEKNGFTVMFTIEHWTNVDNESKYKNNWHVKNMLNENKLKYVHQLQNLYWCLCGEELTIKSN